jgi:hypothetical protein
MAFRVQGIQDGSIRKAAFELFLLTIALNARAGAFLFCQSSFCGLELTTIRVITRKIIS